MALFISLIAHQVKIGMNIVQPTLLPQFHVLAVAPVAALVVTIFMEVQMRVQVATEAQELVAVVVIPIVVAAVLQAVVVEGAVVAANFATSKPLILAASFPQ